MDNALKALTLATDTIKELPTIPEDTAAYLLSLGVVGERRTAEACPLAVLVNRKFEDAGLDAAAYVYPDEIEIYARGYSLSVMINRAGVHDFITGFDNGDYPQLERD